MADAQDSGSDWQPRHIPSQLSAGLDLIAATWLEQWAEAGGWVQLTTDGKVVTGFPDCAPSACDSRLPGEVPAMVQDRHAAFLDGHHHGKMRTYLAFLEKLPHGFDALAMHMRAHGLRAYSPKAGG